MPDHVLSPCVYCGAPWLAPDIDIDHHSDCAMVTGLYPVLDSDLGATVSCVNCGHANRPDGGFCCGACGHEFVVGDHYVLRNSGERELGYSGIVVDCSIVVCVSCEATGHPSEMDT